MSRICNITLAIPHKGRRIHRSGLAKKKGGIGRHVNGGRGGYIRMKLSCKALRSISKNGAYATLKKAGILY